jgi:DNA-binding HxlR family transcriptional regulator
MALACDLLGDRWTMLIIREAFYGVSRFDDLQSDLGIPRGMLSDRLKKLVNLGILERRPYREGTARARAEYHLGARGADLGIPLIALMQWGDKHLQSKPLLARIIDQQTGDALSVALVTADGTPVAKEHVRMNVNAID